MQTQELVLECLPLAWFHGCIRYYNDPIGSIRLECLPLAWFYGCIRYYNDPIGSIRLECLPLAWFYGCIKQDTQKQKQTKKRTPSTGKWVWWWGRWLPRRATYAATISSPELHTHPKFKFFCKKNDTQHGQVGVVVRPVVTPRATYAATISSPEFHTHPKKKRRQPRTSNGGSSFPFMLTTTDYLTWWIINADITASFNTCNPHTLLNPTTNLTFFAASHADPFV